MKLSYPEKLAESTQYVVVNAFDEGAANTFEKEFNNLVKSNQPIIPIIIDSFGGYVYSLMRMVDIMMASPVPVATIVQGKALSCGMMLAAFGTVGYRYVSPTAFIMAHEISGGYYGKLTEYVANVEHGKFLNNLIFNKLEKHIGVRQGYFMEKIHDLGHVDWFLTPEEAVKEKLADYVKLPKLKVNVSLELS